MVKAQGLKILWLPIPWPKIKVLLWQVKIEIQVYKSPLNTKLMWILSCNPCASHLCVVGGPWLVSECPPKLLHYSPSQLDKIQLKALGWDKDRERSPTNFCCGKPRLSLGNQPQSWLSPSRHWCKDGNTRGKEGKCHRIADKTTLINVLQLNRKHLEYTTHSIISLPCIQWKN